MTSNSSKAMPFIVLLIATFFIAVDTFTEFTISEQMVQLASVILVPLGLGGLVNKGWNVFKEIKKQS